MVIGTIVCSELALAAFTDVDGMLVLAVATEIRH